LPLSPQTALQTQGARRPFAICALPLAFLKKGNRLFKFKILPAQPRFILQDQEF
jgi:hypothetical protein